MNQTMNMTTITKIRKLTALITKAGAACIPLAADGKGADSHGGRLKNPEETFDRALVALIEAGALAAEIRRETGASGGDV